MPAATTPAAPRVALVSVGLGRVQRGFERMFGDLLRVLGADVDCTACGSAGRRSAHQRIPRLLPPLTALARALPLDRWARDEYRRDSLAFAAAVLPTLLLGRFDVIHCVDPPLARILPPLLRRTGLRSRVLFTEGTAMPPVYYPQVDHVHQVSPLAFEQAREMGVPDSFMTMIPTGFDSATFSLASGPSREEARRRHGVPLDAFVVLSVSALNRSHKRLDHVIAEVGRLDGNVVLWLDGNPEDAAVVEQARRTLGARCRITHVTTEQVAELYRLADVTVLASLTESFGLAVVEALASGTRALTHASPHFEWLLGERDGLVDMQEPGALARELEALRTDPERMVRGREERASRARQRFSWDALAPLYVDMYRRLGRGEAASAAAGDAR
jgi:glycosyltransferase involved in cell wall biosynthesis